MPTIISVKIAAKYSNFTLFLWISIILSDMLCKIPQVYQKIYPLHFSTVLLFICLPLYLWKLWQKSSNFNISTWISINYSEMTYKNLQFYQKMSPHSFSFIYSCICMPFLVSEILSLFLCFHPFFHTYARCQSSELTEYVSMPFFSIVFWWYFHAYYCIQVFFWINLQFY